MWERLPESHALEPDAPLMITQSSGTTGQPKRLVLTHRQMFERNWRTLTALGLTANERYLQVPHLCFFSGRRRCFKMLMLGATVVLDHSTSPAEFAGYFSDRGITYTYLSPYHLRSLLGAATWQYSGMAAAQDHHGIGAIEQ